MTRVGITGHQHLGDPHAWSWVSGAMDDELSRMIPPLVGVTSLAVGADQLLARLILKRGGRIHAVLPFADIERSFSAESRLSYRELVKGATVEILNTPGTDEDAYLAAGRRVVDLSDVLLAVWNGLPAKGRGGTADVVLYAADQRVPLIYINPVSRSIQRLPDADE